MKRYLAHLFQISINRPVATVVVAIAPEAYEGEGAQQTENSQPKAGYFRQLMAESDDLRSVND